MISKENILFTPIIQYLVPIPMQEEVENIKEVSILKKVEVNFMSNHLPKMFTKKVLKGVKFFLNTIFNKITIYPKDIWHLRLILYMVKCRMPLIIISTQLHNGKNSIMEIGPM